jgi:hypothetical protein
MQNIEIYTVCKAYRIMLIKVMSSLHLGPEFLLMLIKLYSIKSIVSHKL